MIDLRQLEHFVATVESGGVRQAAKTIHLSPSAITRSIQSLEAHFGVDLLAREGRRVYPTAYGKALAEDAQAVFSGVRGLDTKLRQLALLDAGVLHVGFSPSMTHTAAGEILPRVLNEHPRATVEMRQGHADELLEMLVGGEIDLAVAHERPFALHDAVATEFLLEEDTGWWVRNGHPLLAEKRVPLERLLQFQVVSQFVPSPYRAWFDELRLRASRLRPSRPFVHALQVSNYELLMQVLSRSDAVAVIPNRCGHAAGGSGFRQLPVSPNPPPFNVAVAWLRTAPPSPLAKRFVELTRAHVTG